MAAACWWETGGGARREASNAGVQGGRSTGYVPGKATSPRGIGPWNGNRRSGAPRGAASARMHARFAKRANHISALSGAPLPLAQRGKVTGGGETPDDDARLREF